MKKFIGEFVVTDHELAMDIVHALESGTRSERQYEVEVQENDYCDTPGVTKVATLIRVNEIRFV